MKIKEVEYKELVTENYQNCAVGLRAEVEEGETWEDVFDNLKVKVREKIRDWLNEKSWVSDYISSLKEEYNKRWEEYHKLRAKVDRLKKREEKLKARVKELRKIIKEVTK